MLFDNRLLHLTSQTMIIDLIQMRELESVEADKVNLSDFDEIIDVRSPSEYEEDNLPNALNMPVLNDEERKLVGTAYADSEGFWNIILDKPVNPGDYILRFNEIQNGNLIASLETPIRQIDLSEVEVSDNMILVQPGNSLWRISRRFYGEGIMYTLIFKANQNQIDNPDLIYPGQIFEIPNSH